MRRSSAISFFLVVGAPGIASAFSTQGNHWPNTAGQPVDYRIQPDGAPGVDDGTDLDAVRRAFAAWQSVACSFLTFREQPWVDPSIVQADGTNRIFWLTQTGSWPETQRTTIALTFAFYRTTDRVITDADIMANAVYYQWTTDDGLISQTKVDVETIMFHEIGHFLGLDHSLDPAAAMYAANNKPIQRTPANDDVNGVCTLYPNGQPGPGNTAGNGGVGAPCQKAEDCASRLCVDDTLIGRAYCTAPCAVTQANPCGAGYQCTTTAKGDYCLAPPPIDELCDQCSNSTQCGSGLCLTVPGYNNFQAFCTRACDPTNGVPGQCPEGYGCVQVYSEGQTGGVCAPTTGICNPRGKGGHGEPCYANGGCKSNHICVDYFSDGRYKFCYYGCTPALAGQSCTDAGDVICLNLANVPNTAACINIAQPGRPCVPEQCAPGSVCAWNENETIDSAICYLYCPDTGCPNNTQCQFFDGIGAICMPNAGFRPLGSACASDNECESRACRTYGDRRLCTTVCSTTVEGSCPSTAFRCVAAVGVTEGLCWPTGFVDASAEDLDRKVNLSQLPPGYCACDTTSQCDSSCDCDPECKSSGCSCRATAATEPASGWAFAWTLAALCLRLWRSRRRLGR